MKKFNKKLFVLLLGAAILFLSCQNDIEHHFDDALVIWETDSFIVEVENVIFMEKIDVRKKGWGNTFDNFEKKIKSNTRNLFVLAENSSEIFMLESWTGDAYKRNAICVRSKMSGRIETDLTESDYNDVGTSGVEVYVRNNRLFKIIEIVY